MQKCIGTKICCLMIAVSIIYYKHAPSQRKACGAGIVYSYHAAESQEAFPVLSNLGMN